MAFKVVTNASGRRKKAGKRKPAKKAVKGGPAKPSAKRKAKWRRPRRPPNPDPFHSKSKINGKHVAKYSAEQGIGAMALVLVEGEGKTLRGPWKTRHEIAEKVRDGAPYHRTEGYLRAVAYHLSQFKSGESDQRRVASKLLEADMIPRGFTDVVVTWAREAQRRRYDHESKRERVKGEWVDMLEQPAELRHRDRKRGRVMRGIFQAMVDSSFGARFWGNSRQVSVQIPGVDEGKALVEKNGSTLCGSATGNFGHPAESDDRGWRNQQTSEVTLVAPLDWWERVGSKGLATVGGRIVLDAKEHKRRAKGGGRVFVVLYVDTGEYAQGENNYRHATAHRANSLADQDSIRAWRGKVLMDASGEARFTETRMRLKRDGAPEELELDEEF